MIEGEGPEAESRLSLLGGQAHYERVIRGIMDARVSVWIATANVKGLMVEDARMLPGRSRGRRRWRPMMRELAELSERGVELRMLHSGFPSRAFRDEFDAHPILLKGGLELRQCPRVHLKLVIIDGAHLYLGSANWTGAGLGGKSPSRRNFELGIWTEDELLLDQSQAHFDALWQGEGCVGCGRREHCDTPIDEIPVA